ncbi:MAG: histidinol-phosphate transaminase [Alphaproteobacteria bacterium]|nr:histidinol-phosphate transaminase [Alphaproteobacteria bacterium]
MNDALYKLIRAHYRTLEGYVSAGMEMAKDDRKIFLNANENPYELPGLEGLNRYPEPQPKALLEAYARAYGVEADQVVMTRGADEAIVILTQLFCEPHEDAVLICSPTFGMYGVDARSMPAGVVDVPLLKQEGTFALDKDGIIAAATDQGKCVKLVFLCSPNNPTGTSFSHEVISEICEAVEGHAVVVLDETYAEFSENGSMAEDLESTPNLIILRTLSKSYAFAGMRMGCFLCGDTDFTALARAKALEAYPLPLMSIEAAFYVLSPEISALAKENIKKILAERARMAAALQESDHVVHVYPADANFLLVEMNDAKGFYNYAAAQDVILRDFSAKPGTEGCLRISIGTPEQNDIVLKLLSEFQK